MTRPCLLSLLTLAQTLSLEATPSILVVFTSDAHESTVPSIHKHSILIPIVLSESRPVVLFDEKDDRPDETAVDMDELVRQLSNLFTFERDSLATTQTLVQEPDKPIDSAPLDSDTTQSLHSFHSAPLDETILPSPDLDKPRKSVARKRQPLDRLVGPDRADILRKLHANMGPGLTAAWYDIVYHVALVLIHMQCPRRRAFSCFGHRPLHPVLPPGPLPHQGVDPGRDRCRSLVYSPYPRPNCGCRDLVVAQVASQLPRGKVPAHFSCHEIPPYIIGGQISAYFTRRQDL